MRVISALGTPKDHHMYRLFFLVLTLNFGLYFVTQIAMAEDSESEAAIGILKP
jgi:hypothetical protein